MQCPNCKNEMEKGSLSDYGTSWSSVNQGLMKVANMFPKIGKQVFAYKCPKCGKVELTTETGK